MTSSAGEVQARAAGLTAKQNGITMASWWSTGFARPKANLALDNLASTGADWVAFVVTQYQKNIGTTAIRRTSGTVNDDDLVALVQHAHALGLKVMLKPHVDLQSDPSRSRQDIGSRFERAGQWRRWFGTYTTFITHYATLAAANGVEQFSIGTELAGTSQRDDDWRVVAHKVRSVYDGALTYAALGDEAPNIPWWDEVDLIGVDAYYELSSSNNPSVAQLARGWRPYLDTLRGLSADWGMPILFTEIGYASVAKTASRPWDWDLPGGLDLQAQARAYQAALESTADEPWFAGMFWWYWDADPGVGGLQDRGFSPSCKPAADVLRTWYGGSGGNVCPG